MITTVSRYDFQDWFASSETYKNNFSYEGLNALFEYLEEYEESTGEQIEFDPIALCVEWTEYKDFDEIKANYSDLKDMDDLRDNTQVIEFDGGIIIQDY